MNIENEYWVFKEMLEKEIKDFKHFNDLDVTKMSEEQLNARNRGLKSSEKAIDETIEILNDIKIELYDYIYDGGDVSKETIINLSSDLQYDLLFTLNIDDYDVEVLNEKIKYLESLI